MRLQGDYSPAEPMYAEALALARALGDQRSEAHIAQELGVVAMHLGRLWSGRGPCWTEASHAFANGRTHSESPAASWASRTCGWRRGNAEQAARLLGFVEPWLQSNKIQLVHFDRTNYERILAATRAQLNNMAFVAAWEAGARMTLDEETACALGSSSSSR